MFVLRCLLVETAARRKLDRITTFSGITNCDKHVLVSETWMYACRVITLIVPHTGPDSDSPRSPWWFWRSPWPRWSRCLWCPTGRGCRCRSGSTLARLRKPASHQCWQCVNPIRERGEIKRSYGWRQRGDGLQHADPVGPVMRSVLQCDSNWQLTEPTVPCVSAVRVRIAINK